MFQTRYLVPQLFLQAHGGLVSVGAVSCSLGFQGTSISIVTFLFAVEADNSQSRQFEIWVVKYFLFDFILRSLLLLAIRTLMPSLPTAIAKKFLHNLLSVWIMPPIHLMKRGIHPIFLDRKVGNCLQLKILGHDKTLYMSVFTIWSLRTKS